MRPLDPIKQEKILQAVFVIAGRLGLSGVNISGISTESGVGVGSLYTYFNSKEELIQAAYSSVEYKITDFMFKDFYNNLTIKALLKQVYFNTLKYRLKHYNETVFIDQYIQSNYVQLNLGKQLKEFEVQNKPLYELIKRGQNEGIITRSDPFILINFINGSVRSSSNGIAQKLIPLKKANIDSCFDMVWKGITI